MVTRRQVRRALELHHEELASKPEVVGVGAKWDTSPAEKGGEREHAVAVYVVSADRARQSAEVAIPESVSIPARKGEHVIRVVVEEIGELVPEDEPELSESDAEDGESGFFLTAE